MFSLYIENHIGAGKTVFEGWVSTQENLNLLDKQDLERQFQKNSIEAMLAEHVWEHMTKKEGL